MGWWIIYPIINEVVYNVIASCCNKVVYNVPMKSRFVYSAETNLSFCGLERLHPFDAQKYRHVFEFLVEK